MVPLLALDLARKLPNPQIGVLTYAPVNVFSKEAADSYSQTIPVHNHFNFVAEKDMVSLMFVPQKPGTQMPEFIRRYKEGLELRGGRGDYCSAGTSLEFSPTDSEKYNERVRQKAYTFLTFDALTREFVTRTLPVEYWEAHMPETYEALAPPTFKRYKEQQ